MILHAAHGTDSWTHWIAGPASTATIVLVAGVYALGTRAVWREAGPGRGIRFPQAASFAAGMVLLMVALLSPLDSLAEELFAAHMTQHVLLAIVIPPLLVAGAPVVAAMWALPRSRRRPVALWMRQRTTVAAIWRGATHPLTAWTLHAAVMWAWHAPSLYTAALENPLVHVLEHATFVGTAALIWWDIFHPRAPRRVSYLVGIGVLFFTMVQSGALGALLAMSSRVWFPAQGSGAAAWGLTRLEDQQLAGLIMWIPAGALYMIAMCVLFAAWMSAGASDRDWSRAPRPTRGSAASPSA